MTREERLESALRTLRAEIGLWKRRAESDLALDPPTKTERMRLETVIRECQTAIDIIDNAIEPKQISLGGL